MQPLRLLLPVALCIFLASCQTTDFELPDLSEWAKELSKTETKPKSKPRPKPKTSTKPSPFGGKVIKGVRSTAYCHLENEPGAPWMKNAIGTNLRYGTIRSAAADWSRYPLGTQFRIVGQPHLYEIDDYGSALVGTGTIDFYKPTLEAMNAWGLRYVDIQIVKWGSYERSLSYLQSGKYWHTRQMRDTIRKKLGR